MGVVQSHADPYAYTPTCNECGVALCWDISIYDYLEAKQFWDDWRCRDCNPDYRGALKQYNLEND